MPTTQDLTNCSYTPTQWVDNAAPAINAANLNHIEQGIYNATACLNELNNKVDGISSFIQGMIIMWSGTNVPAGWALCDGSNGTPNLVDRFVMGGYGDTIGDSGGSADAVVPLHSHTITWNENGDGEHTHVPADGTKFITNQYTGHTSSTGGTIALSGNDEVTGGAHVHDVTIDDAGVDPVGANLPPYYKLAFIMKL